MSLGTYIKERRTELRFSQRELAKRIDTSNTFISKIERGEIAFPSPFLLQKIANELELDFSYLLQLIGISPQQSDKKTTTESLLFRYGKRDEWLQSYTDYSNLRLDHKILSSTFDAYLENENNEALLLKIYLEEVSAETLLLQIKSLALDLLIFYKENKVKLNVIYPSNLISAAESEAFFGLKNELDYLPFEISIDYK